VRVIAEIFKQPSEQLAFIDAVHTDFSVRPVIPPAAFGAGYVKLLKYRVVFFYFLPVFYAPHDFKKSEQLLLARIRRERNAYGFFVFWVFAAHYQKEAVRGNIAVYVRVRDFVHCVRTELCVLGQAVQAVFREAEPGFAQVSGVV